jgi:hypothetical protein
MSGGRRPDDEWKTRTPACRPWSFVSCDHVLNVFGRDRSRRDDVPVVSVWIIGVIPNNQVEVHRLMPYRFLTVDKFYNLIVGSSIS